MWISEKEYNFLKENAEKNIDAECEILRAKEKQEKAIARAMEEYSAVLKERDELKLKVSELTHKVERLSQRGKKVKINPFDDAIDISLIEPVKMCESESDHDWQLSLSSKLEWKCRKCGQVKYGKI